MSTGFLKAQTIPGVRAREQKIPRALQSHRSVNSTQILTVPGFGEMTNLQSPPFTLTLRISSAPDTIWRAVTHSVMTPSRGVLIEAASQCIRCERVYDISIVIDVKNGVNTPLDNNANAILKSLPINALHMRLIAFDFDGTLSDSEMTVLLGDRCGVANEMASITDRAMNDEISYAQSLRKRAALLEGLSHKEAHRAFDAVELRPGAGVLIDRLRDANHHVAIFTGGFERGVERALNKADTTVDTIVANRLPVSDGELTGTVDGPLIQGTKDDALLSLAAECDGSIDQTIAIGDGANDLPMLEAADLAVGFVPKDAVRPACDAVVASMDRLTRIFEGYNLL